MRVDRKGEISSVLVNIRLTPEERESWNALARYLGLSVSDLLRRLMTEERARLIAEGKKPPRK